MGNKRDRKVYDFKSVGEVDFEREARKIITPVKPIGLKTPMQLNGKYSMWKMHTDAHHQVADNLRNLILTNWGERLGQYFFGANLHDLVFELSNENVASAAMKRIKIACQKWMPFVQLQGFAPETDYRDNKEVAKIAVVITYVVPKLDNDLKALRIVLYIGG